MLAPLPAVVPERLPHTFEPTSYAARLRVDPAEPSFNGTIEITGELAEPSALIWINAEELAITRVTASRGGVTVRMDATTPVSRQSWRALRSEQPLAAGTWTLLLTYAGRWRDVDAWGGFRQAKTGNPQDAGERYVFTQFQPDYARMVFPCFDEPDRKVPWQLTLDVPESLVAASNTPIESETRQGAPSAPATKMKTVRFAKTPPLPSYLIAFAVGPFDVVDAGRSTSGIPIRILTQRGDAQLATHGVTSTAKLLDTLESWLGVPFAYPKLDLVVVPRTAEWWFAMENAGLITMNVGALHKPKEWDSVATHEIAHHWFGDLVTPAWWDEIWLSESFAYWLAHKFGDAEAPERRISGTSLVLRKLRDPRPGKRSVDYILAYEAVLQGRHVLSLVDGLLGSDQLARVLQRYLRARANGTARTTDFLAALEETNGSLAELIKHHAYSDAKSVGDVQLSCGRKSTVLEMSNFGKATIMCVAYDHDGTRRERCEQLAQDAPVVELRTKRCPKWFLPRALQNIALSIPQLEALRDHGWASLTGDERRSVLGSVLQRRDSKNTVRLSYVAKAASTPDDWVLPWITSYLLSIDRQIPTALRPQYDAWILKLFGEQARAFGINREPDPMKRAMMYPLLAVVLGARDHGLVQDAVAQLGQLDKLDEPTRALVLRASIIDKPSVAADLIAELPKASAARMHDIAFVLEAAPDLLALMQQHVSEIKLLQPYQKQRLLGQLCDETRRTEIEQLGRDIFVKPEPAMLRDYEWCIQERKALEPELRAFFSAASRAPKRSQLRR